MSKVLFLISFLALTFFVVKNVAVAADLSIEGNSAGSQNSITVQNQNTTTNPQNNNTNIQNNIKANADSGGNSTTGNNGDSVIITGDSKVSVNVKNKGNTNTSKADNCCNNPTATPTKKPSDAPAPTPTPGPNNGSSNKPSSSGDGGIGGGGSNPEILGLSKTSGNNLEQYLFYTVGLICLGFGGKLFLRN